MRANHTLQWTGEARWFAARWPSRRSQPIFISEAMAADPAKLAVARLQTAIDNVRLTATTDATLKLYLRASCAADQPDTIEYVRQIVAGYGYTDPAVLALRSKRAHNSTQYLQYDYGLAVYMDLMAYLQMAIGPSPRVDGYLLQACGMPSPKKNQAAIDKLASCVKERVTHLDRSRPVLIPSRRGDPR